MSVDLERQLAAYGEHLEMLAIAAAPDTEIPTPVSGRRTYWRGIAVAVAAAVVVFLVVGSIALLSPFSEEEADTVIEPATSSTVPGTTVPVVPIPDTLTPSTVPGTTVPVAPIPDLSASGLLASSFINEVRDLALAPDGTIWVATAWWRGPVGYRGFGSCGLRRSKMACRQPESDGSLWPRTEPCGPSAMAGLRTTTRRGSRWRSVRRAARVAADTTGGVWAVGGDVLIHLDRNSREQISIPEQS